ncbi:MAG: hypothetical protein AB7S38_41420 [Vulcanimicrobiota bacterium]
MMVVAPEPCGWLSLVSGRLVAPWALPRLPIPFFRRRHQPGARGWPGFFLLEAGLRLWAGRNVTRSLRARFWLRRLVGSRLRSPGDEPVVVATLSALELFSHHPGKKILMLDLPLLRQLHADLDQAARHHPHSPFLHRFRAPHAVVARQEAELALADEVWVLGPYAETLLSGYPVRRLDRPVAPRPAQGTDWLLAGPATARNGVYQALELLERFPQARLRVNPGEGLEPFDLLDHPRVTPAGDLEGVGLVLALSWCESYPAEARSGLPLLATRPAGGDLVPGDLEGLVSRLG